MAPFLPLILLGTARAGSCFRRFRGFCFPGFSPPRLNNIPSALRSSVLLAESLPTRGEEAQGRNYLLLDIQYRDTQSISNQKARSAHNSLPVGQESTPTQDLIHWCAQPAIRCARPERPNIPASRAW